LFEAVKGLHVIRKFSYLTGMLGQRVASSNVTIIDDGTIEGGAGTAPFDDQGVKTAKNVIVESGILKMYIYDVYSAKMAGAKPTGNALRESYKDQPEVNPRNLYMVRGQNSPESIIQAVVNGFWVQNTIGFGVDSISGTYSIGAAGRWIREGRLAEPVSGVTIASSLNDLFNGIDAVGNDLEFRYETAVPTFRVKEMTVSGV
jgi:PmbA protein